MSWDELEWPKRELIGMVGLLTSNDLILATKLHHTKCNFSSALTMLHFMDKNKKEVIKFRNPLKTELKNDRIKTQDKEEKNTILR